MIVAYVPEVPSSFTAALRLISFCNIQVLSSSCHIKQRCDLLPKFLCPVKNESEWNCFCFKFSRCFNGREPADLVLSRLLRLIICH